jgi:hypothetical protein
MELVFSAGWSSYEEHRTVMIVEFDGYFWESESSHCVYQPHCSDEWTEFVKISDDELLEELEYWEEQQKYSHDGNWVWISTQYDLWIEQEYITVVDGVPAHIWEKTPSEGAAKVANRT